MARTKGPVYKMKSAAHGGPMRRNFPSAFRTEFPMVKPSEKEITAAASDSSHPMSIESVGYEAHYAWKAGGRPKTEETSTTKHGTGGTIVNNDGSINRDKTANQLGITVAELNERLSTGG